MNDKKLKQNLLWIVSAALILRIVCALPALLEPGNGALIRIDTLTYMYPAKALLSDGAMWTEVGSGIPATTRPPGYIAFLALGFLFGDSLLIPALAGCFFSASSCYPVGLCASLFAGRKGALWASILWGLNLTGIAHAPLILPDTLLGFCCAWALYWAVCCFREKRISCFLYSSLFITAGCFLKPICVPLLLGGMPFLALIYFGNRKDLKKLFACFGIVIGLYAAALMPVMIRNYKAGAEFDMDSNRGEMLYHSGSAILGKVTGEDTGLLRERLRRESETHFEKNKEEFSLARSRNFYNHQRYMALIRKYPKEFLLTHLPQWQMLLPDLPTFLENNRLTVSGRGTLDVMRKHGLWAALKHYLGGRLHLVWLPLPFLFAVTILYVGAFFMGLCLLKHFQWKRILFCCVFGGYLLFAGGPVTMPRYQIPALALLCVLAGVWYAVISRKFFRRKKNV